jgi:dipeptidyl aminopeptidase/acylaminoacyl peptidase
MCRVRLLNMVIGFSLAAMRVVSAQAGVEPPGKTFHKVISLDSVEFRGLGSSPDGRWLTIDGHDVIWILPSDGHTKPARLLSPGYADRSPNWFPTGDRLAFMSDRASRDGSHKMYAMTVSVDPKTGQATALPRQISTDETAYVGQVSPDGKWVTYAVPGDSGIKAVPATGGASRTLVKMQHVGPPFIWSTDGKTLYFVFRGGPLRASLDGVWYKVSADGGSPTRAYENPAAMPYAPNTDMHVVFIPRSDAKGASIRRVELYDVKERLVKAIDVTGEMSFYFPRGTSGRMYAATSNRRYDNSLLTLDGGRTRILPASRFAWVDGWVDNATLTIDGRDSAAERNMVATLDTAGHEGPHVVLPADARGCCGWDGVVGYAVSFRKGIAPANRFDPWPLYIADARSGAIRELASTAVNGPAAYGRGGFYGDGDRFLATILNGQQVELRGITADGRSTLLRAFAKSESVVTTAVNGDLVAWAIASHDSLTIFSARGPNGRPHRLAAQPFKRNRLFQLAWSYDATMLAITGLTTEPSLSVIHVDAAGAPRGSAVVLNIRATESWSLRWTPDNRSVVVTAVPIGARDEVVIRVPVDPKEAPTFYGRNDEWLFVSPDGKHVAYPTVRTLGATIWEADFAPPGVARLP